MFMIWFNLAIGLVLIGLVGLLLPRLVRHWRLEAIVKKAPSNAKLQKKVRMIQQGETVGHLRTFFTFGIGVVLVLFFLLYALFQTENQVALLGKEVSRMKDELQTLKAEQTYYFQGVALKDYPEEGLALAQEPWAAVVKDKDSRKTQGKLEQQLTQKLSPYLGLTTAILTPEASKETLTLALKSDAREANSTHERAIFAGVMQELEEVTVLTQVRYELMTTEESHSTPMTILVYDRTADGTFQLSEDSEKDARED